MDVILFVENLAYWHWFLFGLCMLILEVIFPVSFFLWAGITGLLIGSLAYFFGMSWGVHILLFALIAPIIMTLGKRFTARLNYTGERTESTTHPLNQRQSQLIGYAFQLENALEKGVTHQNLLGTRWKITGPDLPAGTRVVVVDLVENALVVETRQD